MTQATEIKNVETRGNVLQRLMEEDNLDYWMHEDYSHYIIDIDKASFLLPKHYVVNGIVNKSLKQKYLDKVLSL